MWHKLQKINLIILLTKPSLTRHCHERKTINAHKKLSLQEKDTAVTANIKGKWSMSMISVTNKKTPLQNKDNNKNAHQRSDANTKHQSWTKILSKFSFLMRIRRKHQSHLWGSDAIPTTTCHRPSPGLWTPAKHVLSSGRLLGMCDNEQKIATTGTVQELSS